MIIGDPFGSIYDVQIINERSNDGIFYALRCGEDSRVLIFAAERQKVVHIRGEETVLDHTGPCSVYISCGVRHNLLTCEHRRIDQ